jgi:hypothetical protein
MAKKVEATEDKGDKVLITAHLEKDLVAKIDEYQWSNRIEGRAETVRQLLVKATS